MADPLRSGAPRTEAELMERACSIAGLNLGQLAQRYRCALPEKLLHGKGWAGQLLERHLGATAGSRSAPDFELLGIELKSIPVSPRGKPRETTYVCVVPLVQHAGLQWRQSKVYEKLARVLWVPIESEPEIPIAQRRIGMALLWSPCPEQEAILRDDWEELMEMVAIGEVESITARHGVYLQIRPKAADSRAITKGVGHNGEVIKTLPRGFYLRTLFTAKILEQGYL